MGLSASLSRPSCGTTSVAARFAWARAVESNRWRSVTGPVRGQPILFPERLDDLIAAENPARVVPVSVEAVDPRGGKLQGQVPTHTGHDRSTLRPTDRLRPTRDMASVFSRHVYGHRTASCNSLLLYRIARPSRAYKRPESPSSIVALYSQSFPAFFCMRQTRRYIRKPF